MRSLQHYLCLFLRFIGAAEVLGALGLVLPGLVRIRPDLTPLAAAGLLIIMFGATVIMLVYGGIGQALGPLVVGLLSAWVAYGRWRLTPLRKPSSIKVCSSQPARCFPEEPRISEQAFSSFGERVFYIPFLLAAILRLVTGRD